VIPPLVARLADGRRLHLQHGPIDLIIEVTGSDQAVGDAEVAASSRFATVLDELVPQLSMLRCPVDRSMSPQGEIAHRMVAAARRFPGVFVTPMVAVAGSVADEILSVITAVPGVRRAYVNNGGDVAFHLTGDETLRVGLVPSLTTGATEHVLTVTAADPIRGAATSGCGGRSSSFGIADGVTVLATTTSIADAAATLIANAVDLPGHGAIRRTPACELDPDSDLGERLVTVEVGDLDDDEVDLALTRGVDAAEAWLQQVPELHGAVLGLRGHHRVVGDRPVADVPSIHRSEEPAHVG